MDEQRKRVRSGNPAERFAAALLIPAELSRRLRLLADFQVGRLLDDEVCPNMSILAPDATVCVEAAQRLQRLPRTDRRKAARSSRSYRQNQGEHILHAQAALYRAGIPFLQLPWQMNRLARSTFLVSHVADAKVCLLQAGFRESAGGTTVLVHSQTRQAIHLYEDRTRLYSANEEGLDR